MSEENARLAAALLRQLPLPELLLWRLSSASRQWPSQDEGATVEEDETPDAR